MSSFDLDKDEASFKHSVRLLLKSFNQIGDTIETQEVFKTILVDDKELEYLLA